MFTEWVYNFTLLILDTYGGEELPLLMPTYDELRTKFEAGLGEQEALTQLAGEPVEAQN